MNTITVIGNVGKDPETRFSPAGLAITKFSVADTRGKDDKAVTTWHNVVCFEQQAENVAEQVRKGSRVVVIGRLQKEQYTDKEGVKREAVSIIADDVCLSLKWKPRSEDGAPSRGAIMQVAAAFNATEEDPF